MYTFPDLVSREIDLTVRATTISINIQTDTYAQQYDYGVKLKSSIG